MIEIHEDELLSFSSVEEFEKWLEELHAEYELEDLKPFTDFYAEYRMYDYCDAIVKFNRKYKINL